MRKVPISSIADVTAGQGAPKPDEFSDSGIPFVRAGSLEDLIAGKSESALELVPAETVKKRKLKLYPKGSILFAKSGMSATKDRIYVLQNPAYVVSHLAILTSKDNIYRDYLRLALKQFPPSSLIKDPAYPAIGLGEIQGYEIPVPEEIDDQKRIAHLLGKVEGLIARRKQHLQQLDDLLKSVFLEMFGDPVRNEKGWKLKSVNNFSDSRLGKMRDKKFITGAHLRKYLGNSNVQWFRFVLDELLEMDFDEHERKIFKLEYGDLLVCEGGDIGRCAIWNNKIEDCYFQKALHRVRLDRDKAIPEYIQYVFLFYSLFNGFKITSKATIAHLTGERLKATLIPLPPIDLQNQFAAIVEKVESLKSRYQQSLTDLERLYGALSQKAFKGELDLSRVTLLTKGPDMSEEEKPDVEEKEPMEPLIDLPVPAELTVLHTAEGRKSLLGEWLNAWLGQLGDTPFSAQAFMDAARQRMWELAEVDEPEWGEVEYDEVKAWVLEALEQGRLTQSYDDANNRVQITPVKR